MLTNELCRQSQAGTVGISSEKTKGASESPPISFPDVSGSGNEFVNRSLIRAAAMDGGAVIVSRGVNHHSVVHERSVGRALEAMQDAFGPGTTAGSQLENRSASALCRSAFAGGAVEISA